MPTYRPPRSDIARLAFMRQTIETATIDAGKGITYVNPTMLGELGEFTTHHNAYNAAYTEVESALGKRITETAESTAALDKLKMYLSHMWINVNNRAQRLGLDVGVLSYYALGQDGSRPTPSGRKEWVTVAEHVVAGDAKAVAAGFAPIAEPTAVELQAVLDSAIAEGADVIGADRDYDLAQTALADFRPRADALIKAVRAGILFGTYEMDAPSQRRVLRSYGATFDYLPGETIDTGDDAPLVVEP